MSTVNTFVHWFSKTSKDFICDLLFWYFILCSHLDKEWIRPRLSSQSRRITTNGIISKLNWLPEESTRFRRVTDNGNIVSGMEQHSYHVGLIYCSFNILQNNFFHIKRVYLDVSLHFKTLFGWGQRKRKCKRTEFVSNHSLFCISIRNCFEKKEAKKHSKTRWFYTWKFIIVIMLKVFIWVEF